MVVDIKIEFKIPPILVDGRTVMVGWNRVLAYTTVKPGHKIPTLDYITGEESESYPETLNRRL